MRSSRAIVSLKVGPAPTTALGLLAASMGVGTWAQLTGVANQNAVIGSQAGSSGSLIGFGNKVAYNSFNGSIEVMGSDHLGGTPGMRHVRYALSTNAWSLIQGAPAVPGIGHAYDHVAVNPSTGDLYHTQYSGSGGAISLYRKVLGGGSFSLLTTLSTTFQDSHGATWWTGSFTGAGAQGFLLVYDGKEGHLRGYDPVAASVIYTNNAACPGGAVDAYHTVAVYSALKNCVVYGGGSSASNKLWRLNSDGTITSMPNVPSGKAVGVTEGNLNVDPTSGNFLLLSSGQLWELNPTGSGTWTQQTGSRVPPAAVGSPNGGDEIVSASMPANGVISYITQTNADTGNFYLYKHA